MERKIKKVVIDEGKELRFETGKIAKFAHGAVLVQLGETIVFASACAAPPAEEVDFLPLKVDYFEKFSSAGKTLGGFIKREGKLSEREILTSRLIDRPLRPMFEEGYFNEVQILTYVWSYDGLNLPDPLAICASSAALVISEIPLIKPIGACRVGLIDGKFVINPQSDELKKSQLDLVIAGSEDAILMIEGYCDFLTEEQVLEAIAHGHKAIKKICHALSEWQKEVGKPKNHAHIKTIPEILLDKAEEIGGPDLEKAVALLKKQERDYAINEIQNKVLEKVLGIENSTELMAKRAYKQLCSKYMRKMISEKGVRPDGRGLKEIRHIDVEAGILPRTHGNCLFTRGETQTLAVCTLGGESMGQRYEDLNGEGLSRFYLHYFFPPYSVGEVGRVGPPGRREVGHGKLAERSLQSILPPLAEFPYTIRLESNITESNGSSSMASVCGGCLAMMEAGVPIKRPVSGIAMGLILEGEKFTILSDILGLEDALGDMDFKVSGDAEGITAFQMDIKVEGITLEIMEKALAQAKEGRIHILKKMLEAIPQAKAMSIYAPRIETLHVKPSKIGIIIGPGGKQIRAIVEETGVEIDINDDGVVSLSSNNAESLEKAKAIIEALVGEVEVNKIYHGRVTSVVNFGAFVELMPGKEGLCHISEIAEGRIQDIHDHVKVGDMFTVKVLEINDRGQVRLSRKAALKEENQ